MNYNKVLTVLFYEIVDSYWDFLDNDYSTDIDVNFNYIPVSYLNDIKSKIFNNIGFITVFTFLTDFFSKYEFYGDKYNNIQKGLLILFQLITGVSNEGIKIYISKYIFEEIHKNLYIDYKYELITWIDNIMYKSFSNKNTRLLARSSYENLDLNKVTLILTFYDNRYDYIKKRYFLKGFGYKTIIVTDFNGMIVYVSPKTFSFPNIPNGFKKKEEYLNQEKLLLKKMLNDLDFNFMDESDILLINNGFIDDTYIVKYNKENKNIITKNVNISENDFKKINNIEIHKNLFIRFDKLKKDSSKRGNPEVYNLKIKLCSLFLNIINMERIININIKDLHKKWYIEENVNFHHSIKDDNFDIRNNKLDISFEDVEEKQNENMERLEILYNNIYDDIDND
jgi:hypothetical protein